jgi:hypothetical protein
MAVNPEWRHLLLEAINEAAVGITDELGTSAVTFSSITNAECMQFLVAILNSYCNNFET